MRALPILALAILVGCIHSISHDEDAAAKKAVEFAKVAFIVHDDATAYPLLGEELRHSVSPEKYADAIKQMHPSGFPAKVTATQFEPIPGQRALSIVLVGENGEQKFFYRFVMVGTADAGYAVGGFFRSNGPYPGSASIHGAKPLQPLKTPYSAEISTTSSDSLSARHP